MIRLKSTATLSLFLLLIQTTTKVIWAAPYFQITGPASTFPGQEWEYSLWLNPDGETITASQARINFDASVNEAAAIDTTGTRCSFWSPADPSLNLGNQATPYFSNGYLLISCGFAAPGLTEAGLVTKFRLTPSSNVATTTTSTITIDNQRFLYKSTALLPGAAPSFSTVVYDSSSSAYPSPTPIDILTLTEDDLTFVEIDTSDGSGQANPLTFSTGQNSASASSSRTQVAHDDSIPPPPANLEPRLPVTPYQLPPTPTNEEEEVGEVLSISTLKELLIPGKTDADKSVVLFNLVMTLTFILLLAILLWRLLVNSRMNKLKYQHMQEVITGELSMIETKLTDDDQLKGEIAESLEDLREELGQKK